MQSNYIYAQANFIEVISNESIKFSKKGQEKLNRIKNQKLYQEPLLVRFNDVEKVIEENKLEFVLPNYPCKLYFTYQSGEYEDSNNYHWYGTLFNEKQQNCSGGSILFVKKNGKTFGTIDVDGNSYEFVEIENGYQMLYKIDSEHKGVCGNLDKNVISPTKKPTLDEVIDQNTAERIQCLELTKVRVLVLYTPAADATADINAATTIGIQQLKTALTNSGVGKDDVDIELAGLLPFSFTETNNIYKDVESLSKSSTAQSLRTQYQADVVVLLTDGIYGLILGIAAGGEVNTQFENGYAIVEATVASQQTFAHEVGHILGARHQYDIDNVGTIEHAYIFRPGWWPTAECFTIMSGDLTYNQRQRRLLHFSNPNINYNGHATGDNHRSNTAKHFRTTGKIVANHIPNVAGNYYVSLIGSQTPCPWQDNWYEADIRCGKPPFTIQWHTSTNGVNYNYRAAGEFFLFQAPTQNGTNTTIRMTVTDVNGASQIRYIQTTSYSAPNSLSCSENTGNGLRVENNITAKVIPNPIEGNAKLYVELPKADTQTQILIVNTFGKTIKIFDTSDFSKQGEFDISGLPTGLYYVSIRSQLNGVHSVTIHVK
ncbi:T9SS type A sorting domain-containing protein [Bernardetia sp. ABR2-2B]|uniref:T9SS type A sorting domain-containing protein n=1 Tax=Bernardetia sp. ABR2-2B TaxID=3127472 RepID=UPI0030CD0802